MSESKEFNAPSVDEALEKAAKGLGLPQEDLSYTVLDGGSAGFLGMGSRDARIEVTVETPPGETEALEENPVKEENFREEDLQTTPSTEVKQTVVGDSASREEIPAAPEDLLNEVEQFTIHTIDAMGIKARIDVYDAEDFIAVDVASDEAGLFIGQKGETIDAFQYLLNIAIYKDRSYVKKVIVDSEGYRQRRVEAVQGIAHRMARKAVRERRLVELPPMNTSERRIVHIFLKENTQVSTASQGTGDNRRVTVSPN